MRDSEADRSGIRARQFSWDECLTEQGGDHHLEVFEQEVARVQKNEAPQRAVCGRWRCGVDRKCLEWKTDACRREVADLSALKRGDVFPEGTTAKHS